MSSEKSGMSLEEQKVVRATGGEKSGVSLEEQQEACRLLTPWMAFRSMTPERALHWKQVRGLLFEAIDALPENTRQAFIQKVVMELSYLEMAEETGLPIGTLSARVTRGCNQVQAYLKEKHGLGFRDLMP